MTDVTAFKITDCYNGYLNPKHKYKRLKKGLVNTSP